MTRVGVFGGTFDPVHVGHLAIANAALDDLALDRVYFVPARRSPLKKDGPVASPEDRLAMLTSATTDEPRFQVSGVELDRKGPSFTVDTLEALRSNGDLFLILGSDAYADFERWRDPARIRALATVVLAARPGVPNAPADVRMLDSPLMDISSRELRARAARGRSLRYLVPEAVLRYIEEHRLYR
ncbi:MAG TPA: nicotinate-nucleotide adenylyltransferase [Candidatus Bathyarchaeia archaeon]|nr:nicotinate-nucleotide adenylyltransferase [Candidatus Bathyarchaeia archaeon]